MPEARSFQSRAARSFLFDPSGILCLEHDWQCKDLCMAPKGPQNFKIAAENRKARFNFEIGEVFEAGLVLTGTEVKSLRTGKAMIAESYVSPEKGEIFLINADVPEYLQANRFNHERRRPRKLLLNKRQISKLAIAVEREGMTIVPLKLFFNDRGRAKLEIAIARGKKLHDKRETEKARDWAREKGRLLRDRG
jgi:SsrA-binding protein